MHVTLKVLGEFLHKHNDNNATAHKIQRVDLERRLGVGATAEFIAQSA